MRWRSQHQTQVQPFCAAGQPDVSSWRLVTLKAVGGAGERWEVLGVFEKTFSVFKVFDLMFLEADDTLGTMDAMDTMAQEVVLGIVGGAS